jgi:hypothetical protein
MSRQVRFRPNSWCGCNFTETRKLLVEQRGIEPLTSALRTRRSAKLSYCPTRKKILTFQVSGFKLQGIRAFTRALLKSSISFLILSIALGHALGAAHREALCKRDRELTICVTESSRNLRRHLRVVFQQRDVCAKRRARAAFGHACQQKGSEVSTGNVFLSCLR